MPSRRWRRVWRTISATPWASSSDTSTSRRLHCPSTRWLATASMPHWPRRSTGTPRAAPAVGWSPQPSGPRSLDVADAVDGLRSLLRHASGSEVAVPVTVVRRATVTVDPVAFDAAFITLAMHVRRDWSAAVACRSRSTKSTCQRRRRPMCPADAMPRWSSTLTVRTRLTCRGVGGPTCRWRRRRAHVRLPPRCGWCVRVETSPQGGCRFRALLPSAPVESNPAVRPEPSWVRAVRDDLFDTRTE